MYSNIIQLLGVLILSYAWPYVSLCSFRPHHLSHGQEGGLMLQSRYPNRPGWEWERNSEVLPFAVSVVVEEVCLPHYLQLEVTCTHF